MRSKWAHDPGEAAGSLSHGHKNGLARQSIGVGVVVHRSDLGQRAAIGDIDMKLSGVDAVDELCQLDG
ncbi:MAG: hypothetical protein QOF67_3281, partial [Mycobacterium sp.]|nr:hypothetical protein [Mycobacterium sp.]